MQGGEKARSEKSRRKQPDRPRQGLEPVDEERGRVSPEEAAKGARLFPGRIVEADFHPIAGADSGGEVLEQGGFAGAFRTNDGQPVGCIGAQARPPARETLSVGAVAEPRDVCRTKRIFPCSRRSSH